MNYLLTNAQMRAADEYTINELKIPSLKLMERAGLALADEAERLAPRGKIVCVSGGGNNGGDGFVCARILLKRGRDIEVVFLAEKLSAECEINRAEYEMLGGKIRSALPEGKIALLVDCLFGTGFKGEFSESLSRLTEEMNERKERGTKILSADIPSGVSGDDGFAAKAAVNADVTLCIGERKAGVYLGDGPDHAGEIACADIGIRLPEKEPYPYAFLADKELVSQIVKPRKRNSHKGIYGKAAIVAGSEKYTGAAYLSTLACLRSGAGYTTLFTPSNLLPFYALKAPEALLESLNEGGMVAFTEDNFEKLLSYDSVAYGMGTGVSEDVALGAEYLIRTYTGKLILDADALNSLAKFRLDELENLFAAKKCDVLLTPHVKEFSRLSDRTVTDILRSGTQAATEFALRYGVSVLLKNAATVIADGNKTAVNVTGTAGQAKGGSGDVLSGVIAGLCASGLSPFEGGVAGAYLTGKAAELAVQTYGEYSLLATDVIERLGEAFLSLRS